MNQEIQLANEQRRRLCQSRAEALIYKTPLSLARGSIVSTDPVSSVEMTEFRNRSRADSEHSVPHSDDEAVTLLDTTLMPITEKTEQEVGDIPATITINPIASIDPNHTLKEEYVEDIPSPILHSPITKVVIPTQKNQLLINRCLSDNDSRTITRSRSRYASILNQFITSLTSTVYI